MSKIWDAHNHWMPPEVAEHTTFFQKGWSDADSLLCLLDQFGIEKAVLLYPTSDAHLQMGGWDKLSAVYNTALAAKVKEHPDRLIGAGILPADKFGNLDREIKKIKDLGLSCLSLASSYDGRFLGDEQFLPVFERAVKEDLPVFIHSQIINPIGFDRVQDPLLMPVVEYLFEMTMSAGSLLMSGVLSRLKDLKIIFAHFAGVLPFLGGRFDSTYAMLRSRNLVRDLGKQPTEIFKNIYVDTSGVESPALLNLAMEFFGAEKILWGSDFPAKRDLTGSIGVFDKLGITEEEKRNVLGGNLKKIL